MEHLKHGEDYYKNLDKAGFYELPDGGIRKKASSINGKTPSKARPCPISAEIYFVLPGTAPKQAPAPHGICIKETFAHFAPSTASRPYDD